MLEGSIVEFKHRGTFSLDDANLMVGILNKITKKHGDKVNLLINQLECLPHKQVEKTSKLEEIISKEIEIWNNKVRKLGAVPKGLWMVDLDSGDGFYCWKYPETSINFWHDYRSGFGSRIALSDLSIDKSCVNHYSDGRNNDSYK